MAEVFEDYDEFRCGNWKLFVSGTAPDELTFEGHDSNGKYCRFDHSPMDKLREQYRGEPDLLAILDAIQKKYLDERQQPIFAPLGSL
jgi:hypothetical protein